MIWPVKHAAKWGGIDTQGNVVIPFEYEGLGFESEGLLSFIRGGLVGFLNSHGTVAGH